MTNEAVLKNRAGLRIFDVTVDDATGIEKGTILKMSAGDRVGAPSSADNDIFLGITMAEKIANDGRTSVPCARGGIWDIKDAGAGLALGEVVMIKGANLVATTDATSTEMGQNVGVALEDIAASAVGEILVFP